MRRSMRFGETTTKNGPNTCPYDLKVQLEGQKIFMVHNKKEIQNLPPDADIVIFGHSHKYLEQVTDGKFGQPWKLRQAAVWAGNQLCGFDD